MPCGAGAEGSKIGMKTRDDSDAAMRQAMTEKLSADLADLVSLRTWLDLLRAMRASTHLLGRTNAPSFLINFDSGSHRRV